MDHNILLHEVTMYFPSSVNSLKNGIRIHQMQCKFTISSKNRGPTILTALGAHQTPQSTWRFYNTNICYPGCLHSHLMQTTPPCRSSANEHSWFNRIPISHAVPTCPVWLITHDQAPVLHSRCGPCLLITSPLQVETVSFYAWGHI